MWRCPKRHLCLHLHLCASRNLYIVKCEGVRIYESQALERISNQRGERLGWRLGWREECRTDGASRSRLLRAPTAACVHTYETTLTELPRTLVILGAIASGTGLTAEFERSPLNHR